MTLTTISELPIASVIPLNGLIPFENLQNNETQAVSLNTILSNVTPSNKLYLNNILVGTYPAINLVAGSNISITNNNSSNNYSTFTINSTVPSPLTISNVGVGASLYKNFTTTYNFKSLVAGANVTISPDTDTITIGVTNVGEVNTISTTGSGTSLFKAKVGSDLQFKSIIAGAGVSFDVSNSNEIVINSTGGGGGVSTSVQNIGVGTGKVYANTVSSVLRFKTLKAGANILINDGTSEITISAVGGEGSTTSINNTNSVGSKILNNSGQLKTIIAGDGLLINDIEDSLTLSTNVASNISNVGVGTSIYKGFNSLLDRHELKTIKGQDGLIVENLNNNEIVIRGNSTSSIGSTSSTNTLIASQIGSLTNLKVINTQDSTVATIINNSNDLTLNILNTANKWNANRINNVPITFPTSPNLPDQESTLVFRGSEYVTGTPTNLVNKYLVGQSFGSTIPSNNQIFKVSGDNQWALALPSDSTSPLVNFLGFYLNARVYLAGNIIEGLTGLIGGTVYYLNSSSTINNTASSIVIGIALSNTTLWFKPYVT